MRTKKEFTYDVLNGHFLFENGTADGGYLCTSVKLALDNNRALYNDIHNRRVKPTALTWRAFTFLVDDLLRDWYPGYYAASEQLKSWLKTYAAGYDTLAPIVDYIKNEREED